MGCAGLRSKRLLSPWLDQPAPGGGHHQLRAFKQLRIRSYAAFFRKRLAFVRFFASLFASLKSKTKRDARIEDERRFGRVQRRVETRSVVSLSGFIILSAGIQRRRFLCETGLKVKGDNIHERRPWVFAN